MLVFSEPVTLDWGYSCFGGHLPLRLGGGIIAAERYVVYL